MKLGRNFNNPDFKYLPTTNNKHKNFKWKKKKKIGGSDLNCFTLNNFWVI